MKKKVSNIVKFDDFKLKKEKNDKIAFNVIISEIVNHLTGDKEDDITYLKYQMEKYKNHEFGKEIVKECSRIMTDRYPEILSDEFKNGFDSLVEGMLATLDEVDFRLHKGDIEKAYKLIMPIVDAADGLLKAGINKEDKVSKYYSFDSILEAMIYQAMNPTEKAFRPTFLPYSKIYLKYGYILMEMGKLDDAKKILEKAMLHNPCDANIAFEYAEIYKAKGKIDEFYELTKKALKICYSAQNIARWYRNAGYYFIEKKKYKAAQVCYLLSLKYDKNNSNAANELAWIDECNDGNILNTAKGSPKEFEDCCKENNIPSEDDFVGYNLVRSIFRIAIRNPLISKYRNLVADIYWTLPQEIKPLLEDKIIKIDLILTNLSDANDGKKVKTKYKTIKFGKVGQFNLDFKEDIEWFVLDEKDDRMLIMSKYIMEAREYNDTENNSWKESTLRKYLNKDFIKNCFTKKEAENIIETKLCNKKISDWELDNCEDTIDKVFCLSMAEIEKYFPDEYGKNKHRSKEKQKYYINESLATFGNTRAVSNPMFYVSDKNRWYKGNSYFWTRSISKLNNKVIGINEDGSAAYGNDNDTVYGVRPAMWIKK